MYTSALSSPFLTDRFHSDYFQFVLRACVTMTLTAIKYSADTRTLALLDQRLLPSAIEYVECR